MYRNNRTGSRAAPARGFVALFAIVLAMGVGLMASPAEAAPFTYVVNENTFSSSVSVIDTATNPPSVVATVPVGTNPAGVAVAPDGKHAYVTNSSSSSVSVIGTATNTVVATVGVGPFPAGAAVTPDGKHVYVTNNGSNNVLVIDTATNAVVRTPIPVGLGPAAVVVSPDGKHAYVANGNSASVSVINTATNTVETTVPVFLGVSGFAVTPDGKHVYVTNGNGFTSIGTVSVIDTATNTVEAATIPVLFVPDGVAITPDGKHVYVANSRNSPGAVSVIDTATNGVVDTVTVGDNSQKVAVTPDGRHVYVLADGRPGTISVIDTATNKVVGLPIPVGNDPIAVGIIPPPPGIPFLAFNAKLAIQFGSIPTKDAFALGSNFTLSSTAPAINPVTDPVTLQAGSFATTIPPGSFVKQKDGSFAFKGVIGGVSLEALIKQTGTLRYAFQAKATGANLTGTVNTVYATLTIGGDSGATSVTAAISP